MALFSIINDTHNQALHLLSNWGDRHYQGLHQAARELKFLGTRLRRKLRQLDDAYNVSRHVTAPRARGFLQELSAALAAGSCESDSDSMTASGTSSRSPPSSVCQQATEGRRTN